MQSITWFAPILPGRLEQWEEMIATMTARKAEHEASRRRMGVVREVASLMELPDGSAVVCLFQEAEDLGTGFATFAASTDDYDVWFKQQLAEIHGMTADMLTAGLPSTLRFDYSATSVPAQRAAGETVAAAELADFATPTEVRTFPHGRAEILSLRQGVIGRLVLEPGWRWSQDVQPIAGTEWCEAPHFQYQLSGRIHVVLRDGTEFDSGPGQITALPVGHDAWVVGEEPVVVIDWAGATTYAQTPATARATT